MNIRSLSFVRKYVLVYSLSLRKNALDTYRSFVGLGPSQVLHPALVRASYLCNRNSQQLRHAVPEHSSALFTSLQRQFSCHDSANKLNIAFPAWAFDRPLSNRYASDMHEAGPLHQLTRTRRIATCPPSSTSASISHHQTTNYALPPHRRCSYLGCRRERSEQWLSPCLGSPPSHDAAGHRCLRHAFQPVSMPHRPEQGHWCSH
jgi:hypothetical protein